MHSEKGQRMERRAEGWRRGRWTVSGKHLSRCHAPCYCNRPFVVDLLAANHFLTAHDSHALEILSNFTKNSAYLSDLWPFFALLALLPDCADEILSRRRGSFQISGRCQIYKKKRKKRKKRRKKKIMPEDNNRRIFGLISSGALTYANDMQIRWHH